eukprot:COSAG01_NODE_5152_length_4451_cov_13.224724_10_plen_103_part_01
MTCTQLVETSEVSLDQCTVEKDWRANFGLRARTHAPRAVKQKTGGAAHLSSRSTLLLKDEHPPAGLPFDAARSPDATRGATPARTRMASATCPGLTLDGPRLP